MKTRLRMKCSICGYWNRVPVNKIFIEQRSPETKVKVLIPMYEPLHVKDVAPEKPEAKINKYGFLHVNGKLAKHLGAEFGKDKADVPVQIDPIEGGFVVKILKA